MQNHKMQIEKRIYKVGEVIGISSIKRVKKGVYEKIIKSFKINSIDGNTFYGEYLSD